MTRKIAASNTPAIWREKQAQHRLAERVRMAVRGGATRLFYLSAIQIEEAEMKKS
jgi:hypothetical protein